MTTTISATHVRDRFSDIVNRAVFNNEEFIVEKQGRPVVKIMRVNVSEIGPNKATFNPPVFDMGCTEKKYTREEIYE
ncbi:hypothetical protein COV58_02275 [Candidatus Roizmanbacteria bacterium CG11_big_fil_rev_8_21_14_0_20_36_8]|uniref:Antitoxin n=2 Tax=Candidatus Roizmaniibacteriota TaxID=1752723 RepID=A0A2M6IU76_9BACT|nr:MAG: hypothetical protein COV58_02275 [Candidatus Roizmanbacteria bacterium CG11_big_fil_rev_8_21_14_0_20_36_8]PIZ66531.1 MAG: hypothetical protein COY14_00185 [Candidatus Roizmanbacteria bacterium CG_4_10_14_0_2_um_filter_36_9]